MQISTTAPSADQVRDALAQLRPSRPLWAALYLALPLSELPQIAVKTTPTGITWRGVTVPYGNDVAELVTRLATLGGRDGDVYADLTDGSEPHRWIRQRRSGAALWLFGMEALAGIVVGTSDTLDDDDIDAVATAAACGVTPPVVVGNGILVSGGDRRWAVVRPVVA